MHDLVKYLSSGNHPVVVGGSEPSREEFHKRLTDIGYVFIKFTDTQGQTDLGVRIDRQATILRNADFERGDGTVHVEGTLNLNYVPVRCIADIDLATLTGSGSLEIVQEQTDT